jgi:hypothetical protein
MALKYIPVVIQLLRRIGMTIKKKFLVSATESVKGNDSKRVYHLSCKSH